MKSLLVFLISFCFALPIAAQNNNHQFYLESGLTAGIQRESFSGGVGGAFGFFLNSTGSIDVRGREMYSVSYKTFVGSVTANYRHHFTNGWFIGGGFAHQHEIYQDNFFEKPVDAALGTHKLINHRSGINVEGGYFFKSVTAQGFFSRIYPVIACNASFMGDRLPNPLVMMNIGLRYGFKKM